MMDSKCSSEISGAGNTIQWSSIDPENDLDYI
jgi:hypothetical protein